MRNGCKRFGWELVGRIFTGIFRRFPLTLEAALKTQRCVIVPVRPLIATQSQHNHCIRGKKGTESGAVVLRWRVKWKRRKKLSWESATFLWLHPNEWACVSMFQAVNQNEVFALLSIDSSGSASLRLYFTVTKSHCCDTFTLTRTTWSWGEAWVQNNGHHNLIAYPSLANTWLQCPSCNTGHHNSTLVPKRQLTVGSTLVLFVIVSLFVHCSSSTGHLVRVTGLYIFNCWVGN